MKAKKLSDKSLELLIYEERMECMQDYVKNKIPPVYYKMMRDIIQTTWGKQMMTSYKKALDIRMEG